MLLLIVGFIFFFFGFALVVIFIADLVVISFVPFFSARKEDAQNEQCRRDNEDDGQDEVLRQSESGYEAENSDDEKDRTQQDL